MVRVRVCVRSCVRAIVCSAPFSSCWPAFTLTVHINALHVMKVYIDRNNIEGLPVELIRFRKKNSDFIAVGLFEVGKIATDVFMKFGSLPFVRCRHPSVKSRRRDFFLSMIWALHGPF